MRIKTIIIANQKGGVGKTTTTVTLGSGLASLGYRVVIVDMDPQGHDAYMLDLPKAGGLSRWFYDGEALKTQAIQAKENLFILRGNKTTEKVKGRIKDESYGEEKFAKALREETNSFDVVLMDTAPSMDPLHVAGLLAADFALIPTKLRLMDLDGVSEIKHSIDEVALHGHAIDYAILPTFYERKPNEPMLQLRELIRVFPNRVWPPIMQDIKVGEAPKHGLTLWDYAPKCNAVIGYPDENGKRVGGYQDTLERVINLISGFSG
jgi:chromosome partitioning protein